MTANAIRYWELRETKRHNTATESMDRPLKSAQVELTVAQTDYTKLDKVVNGWRGFMYATQGMKNLSDIVSSGMNAGANMASAIG